MPTNNKEYKRAYYSKNKEKVLSYNSKWRKRNLEKFKSVCKSYYENNKKKILKKQKEYRKNNPWYTHLMSCRFRCNNPNVLQYKYYGGRGIECLITNKEIKFLWFRDKAYLMKKPSIDRIDNDGDYCIENCRFIELSKNISKAHKGISKKRRINERNN